MRLFFATIICGLLACSTAIASAPFHTEDFSYAFHLYYDQGRLTVDRTAAYPYDVIGQPYVRRPVSLGALSGAILDVQGRTVAQFSFDLVQGANTVFAPYRADAAQARFSDAQHQTLLSVDISGSSFCNDNGACEPETGEDVANCPRDCVGVPAAPAHNRHVVWLALGAAVALIVGGAWLRVRARKAVPPPAL